MAILRVCFWFLVLCCTVCTESKYMVYNTSQGIVPGKLDVHLVPHTHDDVGWMKTVDQYYVGSNNSIQAFFQRWWRDQSEAVQSTVKQLVNSGQLEFIFEEEALVKGKHYITRTNHITWTMGTDFKYQISICSDMVPEYGQVNSLCQPRTLLLVFGLLYLPKFLLEIFIDDGRVNVFYSTPTLYTDAKYAADESWQLKINDFFPYAIRPNAYFTGYFTSRPALKGYVRMLSGYYLAARQLEFFSRSIAGRSTDTLADALAIAQHHDAVSGTERQHVADDYAKRLSMGYKEAEESVAASLACMVESASTVGCGNPKTKFQQAKKFPHSELDLTLGKKLVIVVYNALGWKRVDVVRLPVASENVTVHDSNGKEIESQILPVANVSIAIRNYYARAYLGVSPRATPKYWLAFTASVPPLGFSTYVVSKSNGTDAAATLVRQLTYMSTNENETIEVGTGNLKLFYSGNEGKLTQFVNNRSLVNASVEQSFSYGSGDSQASGAYIFRPNVTYPVNSEGQTPLTVFRGPLFDEVHQRFNSWIYQITRVYKEKEHAELEFTVGPIPIDDGIGKEILTQITTTMKSNKTFYTDSNGRDFLERIRDYRADWDLEVNEPVAGNCYPINLGVYMKDDITEMPILVDRSVGGSSIVDGQLELMLHRRLLHDDSGGLVFQLNETVRVLNACMGLTIQGRYYLRIDPLGEGAKWRRSFGQEIYSPFLLAFTEQVAASIMENSGFIGLSPLICVLQELEDGDALLRLTHLYEVLISFIFGLWQKYLVINIMPHFPVGEDADLSNIASVKLEKLFSVRKISKVSEMSLSANQEREAMEKKRLLWKVEGSHDERPTSPRGGPVDPLKLVVELAPMEIRTFVINFS
ncbi:hypothetical protein RJ639_000214 [Escallonia herrerae]|uniref:Glycoside hydrolase family 38 central domain-containing protein n=1 Tax=Escallonia herrerae TaxID=1293975 RepID=A0AA88XHK9_9ASTE|nr:hypothetical protein RJ639_000214 [Escallonia herrerae]